MSFAEKQTAIAALEQAVSLIGSVSELAAAIGISRRLYYHWRDTGLVAPDKAIKIEQVTGGHVSRHDLRPDLYPQDK